MDQDKERRIGVLAGMLKDTIEIIEKRNPTHAYDEVNEAFGKHMAYILSKEEFSHFTVADLKPVADVLVDFQNRYFKR
ncbi:hypothetical protein ABEW49_17465 [Bacillus anthracis]|uniref:hypothetical protein n=1 Tax=Bacillus anthracis TaxID=1392 RepID=UPI003D2304A2